MKFNKRPHNYLLFSQKTFKSASHRNMIETDYIVIVVICSIKLTHKSAVLWMLFMFVRK